MLRTWYWGPNAPASLHGAEIDKLRRPETLTEAVVAHIRDAVIRGDLKPEQALPELRLAEELKTARVTIRVALRHLEELGLVAIVPHRGAFVTPVSARLAWETVDARALVEGYAIRLAIEQSRIHDDDIARLNESLAQIRSAEAGEEPVATMEAVMRFHRRIVELPDHQLLLSMFDTLQMQNRRLIFYTQLFNRDEISEGQSHADLLAALIAADGQQAEELMRLHLRDWGDLLVARMRDRERPTQQDPETAAGSSPFSVLDQSAEAQDGSRAAKRPSRRRNDLPSGVAERGKLDP